MTHDDEQAPPDPRRWKALSVLLIAGFMSLLDVSIVNVALPSMRDSLGADTSQLQWVVSGYALAFGLVLVPFGRLGDVRGRRTAFIAGVTGFTVASALCGLAPTPEWLLAGRLLQGFAGGMINPQTSGFIQQLFRGAERGRAFGLLGATIGVSTAVGPITGGALIALFGPDHGWRSVFFVNIPVGVLAVVAAWRLLPAPEPTGRREGLDPIGLALLGLGVLAILLPLVQERTWQGNAKWALIPLGLALLGAFIAWEERLTARGGDPMVDPTLFRQPSYALGSILGVVYFAGFTAIFFIIAMYLQAGLGYTALESGLAVTSFALGSALASAVSGRAVHRFGRSIVVVGLLLIAAGLAATAVVIDLTDLADLTDTAGDGVPLGLRVAVPLLIAGIGGGLVISPNTTLTLAGVPVAQGGTAGGVLQTGQRIGSAVGIAGVGAVFFAVLEHGHGDWRGAIVAGLWVSTATIGLALVPAVADVVRGRRAG